MTFLRDMVEMDDDQLAAIADKAFRLGLHDGRTLRQPITADKLWGLLPQYPRRVMHSVKIRQVYGAGFDIGSMNARQRQA